MQDEKPSATFKWLKGFDSAPSLDDMKNAPPQGTSFCVLCYSELGIESVQEPHDCPVVRAIEKGEK